MLPGNSSINSFFANPSSPPNTRFPLKVTSYCRAWKWSIVSHHHLRLAVELPVTIPSEHLSAWVEVDDMDICAPEISTLCQSYLFVPGWRKSHLATCGASRRCGCKSLLVGQHASGRRGIRHPLDIPENPRRFQPFFSAMTRAALRASMPKFRCRLPVSNRSM